MTEAKPKLKIKRKTAWPEDRPRPEPAPEKRHSGGSRSNGTNTKVITKRRINPGINSYSLYHQRELVIAELLKQPSIPRAARKLGISPKTIQKWLQTEEFNAEYKLARQRVLELSISTIGQHVTEAIETLARNLHCGRSDSEIRAAAVILQWAGKFTPGLEKVAGEKMAGAVQTGPAGATIIVVDGDEENYIQSLESAVQ